MSKVIDNMIFLNPEFLTAANVTPISLADNYDFTRQKQL